MFTTLSKSGVGMWAVIIAQVLGALGFTSLDEGMITEVILAVVNGIGALLWLAGTFLRKDLSWGIFRR